MTSDQPGEHRAVPVARDQDRTSWRRRIVEFVQNVLRLEGTVAALKEENKEISRRIEALQKQVLAHEGQLKVLLQFVDKALDSAVESRAEKAAIGVFKRMMSTTEKNQARKLARKDQTR